jgi:hypothetical protein
MSVGTFDAFFGQETQRKPAGASKGQPRHRLLERERVV